MASAAAESSRATVRSRVENSATPQDLEASGTTVPLALWPLAGSRS